MTSNETTGSPVGSHPVDRLAREHGLVERVLAAAEKELVRLEDGDPIQPAFWHKYLDFLGDFCDRWHRGKEEDVLLAALEHAGLRAGSGPTAELRREHVELRTLHARLAEALTSDDTATICYLILRTIDGQRAHIERELQELFPLGRQALGPDAAAAVTRAFDAVEAAIGPETGRRCAELADELCDADAEAAST